MADEEKVDLVMTLGEPAAYEKAIEKLLNQADPTVGVLALEGLFRIKNQGGGRQREKIRSFLQRWRNDNRSGYSRVPILRKALRELTIFKTFEVPLFIDDYGDKKLLSSYEKTEKVGIDPNKTIICHVTHIEEAIGIAINKELRGSDNKNIMEGCWFGLKSPKSVYGSRYFETTLSKLGVRGLRQGEIVFYKQELNVILYADKELEDEAEEVKKPTEASAQKNHGTKTYVKVSIFVPKRFLPNPDTFHKVISGPFKVEHGGFCVREKRIHKYCFELRYKELMEALKREDDPASIIQEINSRSGLTRAERIRAVFNLFAESCLPDSSLSAEDPFYDWVASPEYRRQLLDDFESAFTTSTEQASGDKTGAECDDDNDRDEELMEAVRHKENPATIIQMIKSWSGPTLEEKIKEFFKLLAEPYLPSYLFWEDLSNDLKASLEYRRQLLDAFEDGYLFSKQAYGDQTVSYEVLMKAVRHKENPATIIQMITSWSRPTHKEKIRAFFKLLAESCLLDCSSMEEDPSYDLKASSAYRRQLLIAFEDGYLFSKQAYGDQTVGYAALMKAVRRKEDPDRIIDKLKSWSGPTLEEKITAFFEIISESCLPGSSFSKQDLSKHLRASTEYRRQLLDAFESGFTISKEASGAQADAERDDDNDTDDVGCERSMEALSLGEAPATTTRTRKS